MQPRVLLFVLLLTGCAVAPPNDLTPISVDELLSNIAKYDGSMVLVQGYVEYAFEGCTVSESPDHVSLTASVWYWPKGNCIDVRSHTKKQEGYGMVWGIYDAADGGHLGFWKGAIKDAKIVWE